MDINLTSWIWNTSTESEDCENVYKIFEMHQSYGFSICKISDCQGTWLHYNGQLFSEGNFGVFKSLKKKNQIFWRISTLASKMGQIKKGHFIISDNT